MKKSQVLAALALIMALGLAAPALAPTIFSASAEEGTEETTTSIERLTPEGAVAPTSIDNPEEDVATPTADENIAVVSASTLDELQAALNETADTILISDTITLTDDLTLDLQGKTLKLADDLYRMFAVQKGNITLKNGTLQSNDSTSQTGNAILWITGSDADSGFENHTTLTVDNDVKIITGNSYGFAVHYLSDKQLARGLTINFAGEIEAPYGISVNGNIQDATNAPVINLTGKVTSTAGDLAIFAAGYAEWNLDGATLTGATPLGLKAGKFVLKNSTLSATGAYKQLEATGSGMNPNGSTIQIENSQPYAGEIEIEVKSGTYESAHGPVFSEYGSTKARTAGSNLKSLSISGGTFKSAADYPIFDNVAVAETVITGGNFNNDDGLKTYLKTDQELAKDENGNFIIQTTNTPVNPEKPDNNGDKPTAKPDDNKNPDGSLPNTGILASIEHAANAVGALGTTVITGVLVASGAALAWFIGSRRKATARSGKSSKSSSKSAKSGRNFRIDRVEVEISAAPRATAKSSRSSAKSAQTASKSARSASKAVSASAKSTSKATKPASKTTKKLPAKPAKTSQKTSSSAKSAPSRKTAVSSRSAAKSAKKRS